MQVGKSLAHYEIIAQIGVGGMGEVWRARDTKLNREVALKFLPAAFTSDAGRHARFRTEAQALAAFGHPNVAGVYSFEDVDDTHFLVMELAEGEDLSVRLQNGPLPQVTTLEIACQIAKALEAAHAKSIIHRDLKPANIKIGSTGEVKILDFGLAKVYSTDPDDEATGLGSMPTVTSDLTLAGSIIGTASYMSPEQARGQTVDKRTDIWAFGCVLYEMLTGKLAFPGETVSDTLATLLRADPAWDTLPADTHPVVARLLKRCLAKDQRQRMHDIADVRLEFEDVLAGAENGILTAGVAEKRSQRGYKRYLVLAVIGWLLVAGLVGKHWLTPPVEHKPVVVKTLTFSGRDWAPNASPDGTTIAFVSDRDGVSRIWLKQLATGNEAPLTEGVDENPRFSPDGSQVLFVRNTKPGRTAYRISVVGGNPRKLMDDVVEAVWSPDGSEVAFLRMAPVEEENVIHIGIADAQTGAERILASVENQLVYALRWVPDGQHLCVNEGPLTGNATGACFMNLIEVMTGVSSRLPVTDWDGSYSGVDWSADSKSMIVGINKDLLSYTSGMPALIVQYDLDTGQKRDLFWDQIRVPRGGWGHSSLTAVNDHQVVFDRYEQYAELHLIPLVDGQPAGLPRVLTTSMGRDRQPVYSPDGKQLLFSSNRSGNIDLWTVNLETGRLYQLTDDPAHDWDPAFSPDGQQILWSTNRSGNMEVWVAGADGSGAHQVSHDGQDAENPTMTQDGQWIFYATASEENLGIWKVRPDGSDAQILTRGAYMLPEVSPDGKYCLHVLLRSLESVIKVLDLSTGQHIDFEINIPSTENEQDVVYGRARWTSDGTGIIYVSQDEDGRSGIHRQDFVIGRDTSDSRVDLAGFSTFFDTESLGMAPDGRSIVISAMFNRRILMMAEDLQLDGWD